MRETMREHNDLTTEDIAERRDFWQTKYERVRGYEV
jgi:hypothetical protein